MCELECNNINVISLREYNKCYLLIERQEVNLAFELQSDE